MKKLIYIACFSLLSQAGLAQYAGGDGDGFASASLMVNPSLPVTISEFTASRSPQGVMVYSQVEHELNLAAYHLERSETGATEAEAWEAVTQFEPEDNQGNQAEYRYEDREAPLAACFYRLRVQEADGSVWYSEVRSVDAVWYREAQLFPNPGLGTHFHLSLDLRFGQATHSGYVADLSGRVLHRFRDQAPEGLMKVRLPNPLRAGHYLIFLQPAASLGVENKVFRWMVLPR